MNFQRPYTHAGHSVIDAVGRIVARGSPELCARVIAGQIGMISRQGDLFDAEC